MTDVEELSQYDQHQLATAVRLVYEEKPYGREDYHAAVLRVEELCEEHGINYGEDMASLAEALRVEIPHDLDQADLSEQRALEIADMYEIG